MGTEKRRKRGAASFFFCGHSAPSISETNGKEHDNYAQPASKRFTLTAYAQSSLKKGSDLL